MRYLLYTVFSVCILLVWQHFGSAHGAVRLLISSPEMISEYMLQNPADLIEATLVTLYEAFVGLLIATAASLSMMVVCLYFPKALKLVLPLMVTSQVVPLIVLAPFLVILFGIGYSSKIVMAAIIAFFPIFVNFATGVKQVPAEIIELNDLYRSSKTFRIFKIYFPLSRPHIIAGLKISATLAVIGAIVAEFTGAKLGLGKNLFLASKRLEPELLMSSLFLSTLLGLALFGSVHLIDRLTRSGIR